MENKGLRESLNLRGGHIQKIKKKWMFFLERPSVRDPRAETRLTVYRSPKVAPGPVERANIKFTKKYTIDESFSVELLVIH